MQNRFLIYAYVSCAAIVVGSLGPRASGYLGSDGVSGAGILALVGTAVVALALWRWSTSRNGLMLTFAQMGNSLSLAAAFYALYDDVYKPYVDAGDTWFQYIGWGLVLVLLGAMALFVLLLRPHRKGLKNQVKIGLLISVLPVALVCLWAIIATASDDSESDGPAFPPPIGRTIPAYALKVAGGESAQAAWKVWVFGRDGETCIGTRTVEKRPSGEKVGANEESHCDLDVPPRYWQLAAEGPLGGRDRPMLVLIVLTRSEVGRLEISTGQKRHDRKGLKSRSVNVNLIRMDQAQRSRLASNIGYALAVVPSSSCVRQVRVFDQADHLIKRSTFLRCKTRESRFQLP